MRKRKNFLRRISQLHNTISEIKVYNEETHFTPQKM